METVVLKLRDAAAFFEQPPPPTVLPPDVPLDKLMREAADKIEGLQAALKPFAEAGWHYPRETTNPTVVVTTFRVEDLQAATRALEQNAPTGDPACPQPLIRRGEGEPASDPGFTAGSPVGEQHGRKEGK